ncbi:hypothetical protein [Methylobacterium organophilum]|uniref:hypothetical protein n=1 Tax=Methylobacterium organophilum TaxID=410 RepID=UPI001EE31E1E|nr:hypothetical protein [Methylobacterium organophilum]
MGVPEIWRLKQREDENSTLKRLVTDLPLDRRQPTSRSPHRSLFRGKRPLIVEPRQGTGRLARAGRPFCCRIAIRHPSTERRQSKRSRFDFWKRENEA